MKQWGKKLRSALYAEDNNPSEGPPATLPVDATTVSWDASNYADAFTTLNARVELTKFVKPGGVGVELGVASGVFSELILQHSELSYLYSIDAYADRKHPVTRYRSALARLAPYRSRNSIIRMRFDEALGMFPNEYFDFIYVDGCAGNGEEDGKSFYDWWPKLKKGGLFAGHDYSPDWPLVMKAANRFVAEKRVQLNTVGGQSTQSDVANRYASWFTVRP
jgi:hypothetical protein